MFSVCDSSLLHTYIHIHTYIYSVRSFDYYNRSHSLATIRSLFGNDFHPMVLGSLKGFQPDFREQSELVHSHFTVLPLARCFAVLSRAIAHSLKHNARRKFREKNEYVDKNEFASSEGSAFSFAARFSAMPFALREYRRFYECVNLRRYPKSV